MTSPKGKVFVHSILLCENNWYLGTQICEFFTRNGYLLVDDARKADILVLSTCGVTDTAEKKCVSVCDGFIRRYRASKKIVLFGCLVGINESIGGHDEENVVSVGARDLGRFNQLFPHEIPIEELAKNDLSPRLNKGRSDEFWHIQLGQGCLYRCTYCAIKKAKGSLSSKPQPQIMAEVSEGLRRGYKRMFLFGDDCGSYGVDIGTDIGTLLGEITRLEGDFRVQVLNINPIAFLKNYAGIESAVMSGKIEQMNIGIQSASGRILKLMKRHYDVAKVLERVQLLRSKSRVRFYADVIVCFPTETRLEFHKAIECSRYFDTLDLFLYSPRRGTPAADFEGQIAGAEREFRRRRLIDFEKRFPEKFHLNSF